MNLVEKKILFIAPHFHEYHLEIKKALEKLGAEVTYFDEVFYSRVYTLVRDKSFSPLNRFLDELYFKRILKVIKKNEYDTFFLIRGGLIDDAFVQEVRSTSPSANFFMYQWDSLIHNNYQTKIPLFNQVYTFDKNDAKKLNIEYLPLFYTEGYAKIKTFQSNLIWDICFFGTYHSDRLEIIKKVDKFCKNNNLKFHHHLYAGRINLMLLLLRKKISFSDLKYFKSYTVTLNEIIEQYRMTKAVLDVEMNNQTGLTMRTLEALGSGRKLLTTNTSIRDSEIYDKNFIQILDRNNPQIDISFLNTPTLSQNRYDEFNIVKWISKIMGI